MRKRSFILVLFLAAFVAPVVPANATDVVARVPMPQLTPLQWELLRQQQGGHFHPLPIDVNLAMRYGKILSVSVRRGSGHDDIDKAIVKWIETYWTTYPSFAGGDSFVISMNIDPAIRKVVFRRS
jgi:hypothetical protein